MYFPDTEEEKSVLVLVSPAGPALFLLLLRPPVQNDFRVHLHYSLVSDFSVQVFRLSTYKKQKKIQLTGKRVLSHWGQ